MSKSERLGDSREVRLSQGVIRYRETGAGPVLVFVHGLLVNGDLWRKVVPALADDFRCITPDWPLGSHEEPMNEDADLTPPGLARIVADFLEELDLDDVTIVANDTGGAITQVLAANHPDRVGRVVLTSCDTYENFLPPMFKYLQVLARVPGSTFLVAQTLRVRPLLRLPMVLGRLAKRPIDREATDSYAGPVQDSGEIRRDLRKVLLGIDKRHLLEAVGRLRRFEKPVLLAWSAEDRVFPLSEAERLASDLPNARIETIQDSYSFSPEDQPGRVAEIVRKFAAAREPAPTT